MLLDLSGKRRMCKIIFSHHQQAACILVNAVNDARADHTVNAGKACPAVIKQCVHKRVIRVAGRRVHHHALRLIDYQKVVILIADIQWDFLRLSLDCTRLPHGNTDTVARLNPIIFRNRLPIFDEIPLFDQPLYGRTAQALHQLGNRTVHTLAIQLRRN